MQIWIGGVLFYFILFFYTHVYLLRISLTESWIYDYVYIEKVIMFFIV